VRNQVKFISKNPFEILSLQSKVMNKFQRGVGRDIFFDVFKHPLRNLSITFYWRLKISNRFFGMKFNLISHLILVQSFLKKNYSTMTKWGLKFFIKYNFDILTMSSQVLIFKLSHTFWGFMVENWFQYKNDISHLYSYNFHWDVKILFIWQYVEFLWCFLLGFLRFLANLFNTSLLMCLSGLRFNKKKRAQYRYTQYWSLL